MVLCCAHTAAHTVSQAVISTSKLHGRHRGCAHRSGLCRCDVPHDAPGTPDRLYGVQIYPNHHAVQGHLRHCHLHPATCKRLRVMERQPSVYPIQWLHLRQLLRLLQSLSSLLTVPGQQSVLADQTEIMQGSPGISGALPGAAQRSRHVLVRCKKLNCLLSCKSLKAARDRYLRLPLATL